MVLLGASAAAEAGPFIFHDGKTVVHVNPGVKITLNGKPVESAELRADSLSDQLHLGDLTLYVHASGKRSSIRLRDKNSRLRKNFAGLDWFPIDETFRVTAHFVPYRPPKQIEMQN